METTTLRNQFNSTALQERLAHFPISDKFIPHPRCHSCGHEADHLLDHPPREQSYMKAEKESQKCKKCFPAALEKTLYNSAKKHHNYRLYHILLQGNLRRHVSYLRVIAKATGML